MVLWFIFVKILVFIRFNKVYALKDLTFGRKIVSSQNIVNRKILFVR